MTSSICANWPPSHRIRRGAPLPAPIWFQGPNHEVSRAVSRRRLTFQLSARNLIRSQRAVKLKMNAYCDSGEERILSALGLAQNDRLHPDMIPARLKVFGSENVDPRTGEIQKIKVVMSWLTHTTMAIAIQGRVTLTDTLAYSWRELMVLDGLVCTPPVASAAAPVTFCPARA